MKKYFCLLLFASMVLGVIGQPQWIAFTDTTPKAPRISLQSSSNQQVRYLVQISGMYQESITVGAETYQRLSIPKTSDWGIHGYPELPAISKLIAVPECDSITIGYLVTDSIVLNNYNVYPKPLMVEDSNGLLVEQFYKIDSIYLLNQFMPEEDYKILMDGYLRNQRTAQVAAYPIKYNPVTDQLIAYTEIVVSLTFNNSQGDVNVSNGLLSNLTKNALLNYTLTNDHMQPVPVGYHGTVSWETLNSPDDANDLVADYVIITDGPFFSPQSQALQALAQHRASFNGFDVVIVSVDNILVLNFEYNPSSPTRFHDEQKIRSFIKRVYDGQNAAHTYDGRLDFVCLVGDAYNTESVEGVPTSYDPYPTGIFENNEWKFNSANDYYFTCVTEQNGNWDNIGDLFIGRLCVEDENELNNIVAKILNNENEYSFDEWRRINTILFGSDINPPYGIDYIDALELWLNDIATPPYSTNVISIYEHPGPTNWKEMYMSQLNTTGSNIVFHYGHGEVHYWSPELTQEYKKENLSNTGKYPFVISQSCNTGFFTNVEGTQDGMGEDMLKFHETKGYVAYLGAWHEVGYAVIPASFPYTLQEKILSAVYENLSTVLGESILEARIRVISSEPAHFHHNLFGDPALNLMAPGYEITHNTTLPPPAQAPSVTTISTKVYVRSGATLTLNNGAVVEFSDNGQLIIDEGAILAIGDHVIIKGQITANSIVVNGVMCGIGGSINNPVPIENLTLESIPGTVWKGIEFNNPGLTVSLEGGSIENCQLTGRLARLNLTDFMDFQNSAIVLDQTELFIDQCDFTMSHVHMTNMCDEGENDIVTQIQYSQFQNSYADAIIRLEHYPSFVIRNCTINYAGGTGIDLYYSGEESNQNLITHNLIQGPGGGQITSWGVKVYNSFADIENNYIKYNRYGVSCLNSSHVKIQGNPSATSSSQTQNITYNYQNQVRASDNSFPYFLHYNILQNTPTGSTYLIYYDPSMPDPPPIDNAFNVRCNCFDNDNPVPQLYPIGWYNWFAWCPPTQECEYEVPGREDFEEAIALVDSGQFESAETQFKEVISDYPGSKFAQESAKNLIPLTKKIDQNFPGLINYFDTAIALQQDSTTAHLVYRLKNKCTVEMDQYEQAITWFEQDILYPASEQDSLFSLIDLSDTYMLMEADSLLKSAPSYTGSLVQYKPATRAAYVEKREEWVKLLFSDDPKLPKDIEPWTQNESNIIKQIIPNPFNATTELFLEIPEQGTLVLLVHNLLGQEVLSKAQYFSASGQQTIVIDLSEHPDGVYLVTAQFNGEKCGRTKAIKFD